MPALEGFDELDGIELIQKLPIFRGLNFDETRRLGAIARSETRHKGEIIVDQNELGSALYVIKSGTVNVAKQEGDAELDLGKMGVGDLFGEMTLVDDVLTSARVTANEDVELLVLPRPSFDALLDTDAALALKIYRAFCRTLSDKLRQLHQKMGAQ